MFTNPIDRITNPLLPTTSPYIGRLRQSDINIDGFPDVFMTLTFNNPATSSKYQQSFVLINAPCTENTCNKDAQSQRQFSQEADEVDSFNSALVTQQAGPSAVMIVPIDIDEDGRIDILVQKAGSSYSLELIYNNMFYDSFFIKAMMVSQNQEEEQKFGSITTGGTFRFIVTTLDDKKFVRVASQNPQSSYNSLELPFVYMGVGRSNNYLEQFNVAYSINNRLD